MGTQPCVNKNIIKARRFECLFDINKDFVWFVSMT